MKVMNCGCWAVSPSWKRRRGAAPALSAAVTGTCTHPGRQARHPRDGEGNVRKASLDWRSRVTAL